MSKSAVCSVVAMFVILSSWGTEFVQCENTSFADVNSALPETGGEISSAGHETAVTSPVIVNTILSLSTLLASYKPSSLPLVTSLSTSQSLFDSTTTSPTTFSGSTAAATTSQTQGQGQSTEVISSSPSATSPTVTATSSATTATSSATTATFSATTTSSATITATSSATTATSSATTATSPTVAATSLATEAITLSPTEFLSNTTASNVVVTSALQTVTSSPVSGVTSGTTSLLSTTTTGEVQTTTTNSQTSTVFSSSLSFHQSTASLSSSSQQPVSDVSQTQSDVITTVTMAASSVTSEHVGPANQVLAIVLSVVLGTAFVVAVLSIGLCCCIRQKRRNRKSDKGRLAAGDAETGQNGAHQEPMTAKVNHKQEDKDASFANKSDEHSHDSGIGESSSSKQKTLKNRVISLKNVIRNSLKVNRLTSHETRQPLSHKSASHTSDAIIASTEDLSLAVPRGTDILVNYKKAQPPKRKPAGRDALKRQMTVAPDNDDINIGTTGTEENNEDDATITVF